MKASDIGSSFFLMALGGFTVWQSTKLSLGAPRMPGPGFFPFCLGLLLIAVALVIHAQGRRSKSGSPEAGLRKGRVILALSTVFAYSLILEPLGYLLSTFSLMFILLRMMIRRTWWFGPVVACVITLVSYILFKVWLKVFLPAGILSF
ncbi:MAG: tripartite tricarboxylate transporter TctB family protein [Thermodesulfobacteriota bacterium]